MELSKLRMKRIAFVLAIALVAIVTFAWPDLLAYVNGARPENRSKVYALRNALVPGMTAEGVAKAITQAEPRLRQTWLRPDRLSVSAPVGFLESVYLEVDFSDGLVVHARIRDDKGRTLADAPSDF